MPSSKTSWVLQDGNPMVLQHVDVDGTVIDVLVDNFDLAGLKSLVDAYFGGASLPIGRN